MAVSQKKKPVTPDISANLRILNGEPENFSENPSQQQIQTGAFYQNSQDLNSANLNPHDFIKTSEQTSSFSQTAQNENPNVQKKTSVKDTQIIFRTTEENKNQLKGFFATYGITLSKGIQLACFYLEQQIKNGNVEINAAGLITKNGR